MIPAWFRAELEARRLYVQTRSPEELDLLAHPYLDPVRAPDVPPGTVVRVAARGVWHEGIVTDRRGANGWPTVISKSVRVGIVAEEPWETFAQSGDVDRVGYLGQLAPGEVLARARARIGELWTPWSHCQIFTRECHGLLDPDPVIGEPPAWAREGATHVRKR